MGVKLLSADIFADLVELISDLDSGIAGERMSLIAVTDLLPPREFTTLVFIEALNGELSV